MSARLGTAWARRLVAVTAALGLAFALPSLAQRAAPHPGASRNIDAACKGVDPWSAKGWAVPAPPAHVYGGTWYVGTCGITSLLVETGAGLVLLDGGVPEASPLVIANIRRLGFNPRQIRWILVSHEHWDHAGAVPEIQKLTGARIVAGPNQLSALSSGKASPDDPQLPFFAGHELPPLKVAQTLRDRQRLTVGDVSFVAVATPAHSPGSTSWYWKECEGGVCRTIAYADSVSTPAPDGFRFSDHPPRIRGIEAGLTAISAMPCDILITPHPAVSDLLPRLSGVKPLAQPGACLAYARTARETFTARIAAEKAK